MKTKETTNWNVLLQNEDSLDAMYHFAFDNLSGNEVASILAGTDSAGEFRKLVRSNGTQYARRLTRKALRYRGLGV